MGKLYLESAIKQFGSAVGEHVRIEDYNVYLETFKEWLKERRKISENYKSLLREMDVDFKSEDSVEVGKGRYDCIVESSAKTSVATPYSLPELVKNERRIIIPYHLFVSRDGIPYIFTESGICRVNNIFSTYMTHNPYSVEDIANWEKLPNSDNGDIVVGIYGSTFDKDYDEKLEMLKKIKSEILGLSKMDGGIIRDRYCFAVVSKQKEKIKVR